MTYNELKKKYMLHEISKDEYEKGKEALIRGLIERYEECEIAENDLTYKLNIINEKEKGLS